ncbi:unnamed protein product [Caenorhabditis brenneri]
MLYFASFFCPSHTERNKHFDENRKKPCLGKCGHTICLACVENSVHCPICNKEDAFVDRTINYGAMEIMSECRSNILNVAKSWWAGEKYGSGQCSKCFVQTDLLRLCMLCNGHMCCIYEEGDVKLFVVSAEDLVKLSQCVICANCALQHHDHPEEKGKSQKIIKIEEIKVDSDARRITAEIIMDLLEDEIKNGNLRLSCKLRIMKLRQTTYYLSMVSEELDGFGEEDCGYLGELIKSQLAKMYIENTWTEIDRAFNGPVCECTRLYEELLKVTDEEFIVLDYQVMSLEGVLEFAMGCSLDFKENAILRDEIYSSYLKKTAPDIDYTKAINTEGGCELCIYYDYFDEKTDRNTEYYRDHCMEIYDNFWKSEMPSIEFLCFRCLSQLNKYLVGRCCKEVKEQWQMKRADLDELAEPQRRYGARQMDSDSCKHERECILTNGKFWNYAVKLEIRENAYKIFKEQIDEAIADDQTRSKVLETLEKMDRCIGEIHLREDTEKELLGKVARIDEILEELKIQWENFECRMEE